MLKVPELAGQSVNCPHCRRGFVFPGAAVVQQNVLPQTSQSIDHVDEIKHVGFWVAAIISLPSLGLPTVMSVLGGRPRMGFEDALTIANVFWLTAPMTLGIAVDSWLVVEFSKPRSPLRRDLNGHTLLFTLALVIVASGLIGTLLAGLPNPLAEPAKAHGGRFNVMGLAVSAFNIYFIAYGPGMFFSSLVVGVFLGWIWAVKLPAILDQQ